MADINFNERASEQAQLQQYFGPIVAGLAQGAPDCWPKINRAVNALRVAATRAVTQAWNVVNAREATIHQLTNQINNQLLPRQYELQRELTNCKAAVQQWQHHAAQLQQQMTTQLSSQNRQLQTLHSQLATNARGYASAILARNREIEELRREREQCRNTVTVLRTDDTSCQSQLAHCKTCR